MFDTVAALGSRTAAMVAFIAIAALTGFTVSLDNIAPWWIVLPFAFLPFAAAYWIVRSVWSQVKTFADDKALAQSWWHPRHWAYRLLHAHLAWWSGKHYDRYLDKEVRYARHALAIDEDRARFPRVEWGRSEDYLWHRERGQEDWLVQPWFAGNHSDIGGSYPEEESRLSDIALDWMVGELKTAMGETVKVLDERLIASPDPLALQHSERTGTLNAQPGWLRWLSCDRLTWRYAARRVDPEAQLHPTVYDRLAASHVPQMGEVKPYRPASLRNHRGASARQGGQATCEPRSIVAPLASSQNSDLESER